MSIDNQIAEIKTGCDLVVSDALDDLAALEREKEGILAATGLSRVLASVEAEIALVTGDIDKDIKALGNAIRARVTELGYTIKGVDKMAVFSQSTSWNTEWLENYANGGHPEIFAARKINKPRISLRKR